MADGVFGILAHLRLLFELLPEQILASLLLGHAHFESVNFRCQDARSGLVLLVFLLNALKLALELITLPHVVLVILRHDLELGFSGNESPLELAVLLLERAHLLRILVDQALVTL